MKEKSVCKIYSNGDKAWYLNDEIHRGGDLPAVIYINGTKVWYINNSIHRTAGAAVELGDGTKHWYLNGKEINCNTQEEFEYYMKWKVYL